MRSLLAACVASTPQDQFVHLRPAPLSCRVRGPAISSRAAYQTRASRQSRPQAATSHNQTGTQREQARLAVAVPSPRAARHPPATNTAGGCWLRPPTTACQLAAPPQCRKTGCSCLCRSTRLPCQTTTRRLRTWPSRPRQRQPAHTVAIQLVAALLGIVAVAWARHRRCGPHDAHVRWQPLPAPDHPGCRWSLELERCLPYTGAS
mmetsp:Transcript_80853/g.223653  ORF Transcript_80853/g.223653 Transcript_80853/m.223653 type:complete len:205 (-) Transcript_80853:32-646(-)